MTSNSSGLGLGCCNIGDVQMTRERAQNTIGQNSGKKPLHARTEKDVDDVDNMGKKVKTEAGSSSSNNTFRAIVTDDSLQEDSLGLYALPLCLASSNGFRRCSKIVITDGGNRSWELDLMYNESEDTFYVSRGWKHFCERNGRKDGSFITFEVEQNEHTPTLRLLPTEGNQNNSRRSEDANQQNPDRFVTIVLSNDSLNRSRLYIPIKFLQRNGMNEAMKVTLVGKDGTRIVTNLLQEKTGRMGIGSGWKGFAKANGLMVGKSFTLEGTWINSAPFLFLSSTDESKDDSDQEYFSQDFSNEETIKKLKIITEEAGGSSSSSQNGKRLVSLALVPDHVKACKLNIPSPFMVANGIKELGKITILGRNNTRWWGYLSSPDGTVDIGNGWKNFCKINGVKIGELFTLEFIGEENKRPVFRFYPCVQLL